SQEQTKRVWEWFYHQINDTEDTLDDLLKNVKSCVYAKNKRDSRITNKQAQKFVYVQAASQRHVEEDPAVEAAALADVHAASQCHVEEDPAVEAAALADVQAASQRHVEEEPAAMADVQTASQCHVEEEPAALATSQDSVALPHTPLPVNGAEETALKFYNSSLFPKLKFSVQGAAGLDMMLVHSRKAHKVVIVEGKSIIQNDEDVQQVCVTRYGFCVIKGPGCFKDVLSQTLKDASIDMSPHVALDATVQRFNGTNFQSFDEDNNPDKTGDQRQMIITDEAAALVAFYNKHEKTSTGSCFIASPEVVGLPRNVRDNEDVLTKAVNSGTMIQRIVAKMFASSHRLGKLDNGGVTISNMSHSKL
ncbi:hypothetical protein CEUSTIGMA_g11621.t1, partial [Chlamydomonas eustigma]